MCSDCYRLEQMFREYRRQADKIKAQTDKCLNETEMLCSKFINKVETGLVRSVETYADCIKVLNLIIEIRKSEL